LLAFDIFALTANRILTARSTPEFDDFEWHGLCIEGFCPGAAASVLGNPQGTSEERVTDAAELG